MVNMANANIPRGSIAKAFRCHDNPSSRIDALFWIVLVGMIDTIYFFLS